jgi:hypothetical protein
MKKRMEEHERSAAHSLCFVMVLVLTLALGPLHGAAAAGPEVLSASHRGAVVKTALPFDSGHPWQLSSTEVLWNWVEWSPCKNFEIGGSEVWVFYVIGGEVEMTLRTNYKRLHGAVSVGAGDISCYDEGESHDTWTFVKPTITYGGRGWDATIGYVFSSKPKMDIVGSRVFSLLRFRLTERLGTFLEGQHYATESQDGEGNCIRGYVLQALRYQAGDVSLDFGVAALYELEHRTGLSYDLGPIIPLPYLGVSVGF